MADDTDSGPSTHDWMLDQVFGDGPALIVADRSRADDDDVSDEAPAVLDDEPPAVLDEPAAQRDTGPDINAGAKRAAVGLGSGVLVVAVLIVLAFVVFGGAPDRAPGPQHHTPTPAVAAAPTSSSPVPQQDQAVLFTARTDSCSPAGGSRQELASRSPQALTDTATDSAWVCGRGPQESFLDGQVLHVAFTCDPSRPDSTCSYMLNSVAVTPGWVAKTPGGKDEWLQHRVVTRLQFNFFNGNQLVADPFFLDTHSVHGPVSATLPARILASRVDVVILHTERPPAAPLPTTTGPTPSVEGSQQVPGPLLDSVLGTGSPDPPAQPSPAEPTDTTSSDPVDATFAMSQLQFFGHSPN